MPAELTVIPRVPIAQVGTWAASTGEWEATRAQFEDAVAAFYDPTVMRARLYLGHNDERIAAGLDTTPAVGWPSNPVLENDTLYVDFNVPTSFAEQLPFRFPGRSIEARTNVVAASGRRYSMVLTAVALLGTEIPAVEPLPDLSEVLGIEQPRELVAAEAAETRLIVCALSEGAAPASAGPDNPRQEAPMPTPAPAEEPKTPANDPKAKTPEGEDTPKVDPKAEEQPKEPAKDVEPKDPDASSSGLVIPDGFTLVEKGKYDELTASVATLTDTVKTLTDAKLEGDADEFAGELVAAGKIAASSKPKIVEQFKANPDATRAVCDLLPEGVHEAPPTGRVAATRADDDADGEQGDAAFSTRLLTADQIADAKARGLIQED